MSSANTQIRNTQTIDNDIYQFLNNTFTDIIDTIQDVITLDSVNSSNNNTIAKELLIERLDNIRTKISNYLDVDVSVYKPTTQ